MRTGRPLKEQRTRAARGQINATRRARRVNGAALLLMLALALGALSSAMLGAPVALAAAKTALASTPTDTATTSTTVAATNTLAATSTPAGTATTAPTATATSAPAPTATTDPNHPYNLDITAATAAADWPQSNSNWCGVATVAAIADYLYPGAGVTQPGVFGVLNTNASPPVSEWGAPPSAGPGRPYIPTDIAQDFGTDPRSIAEGLAVVTGRQYHVIVDTAGAWDATIHIVDTILNTRQPVSVFVDHGEHSVLVTGVDTTGDVDPRSNPNAITTIYVWDPGTFGPGGSAIQSQQEMAVPLSFWLGGNIGGNAALSYYKDPYASNLWQGIPLDPDPIVGPYAYVPGSYNHMWVGHWVYVAQSYVNGLDPNFAADWELTPGGALYSGFATSQFPAIPAGYTGPTVQMPTNPPPPPPPVQPPKIAPPLPPPPPAPTATPIPTATPRPRATPAPYVTPAATVLPDPPQCSGAGCALRLLSVTPGPLAAGVILLILLGLALSSPLFAPRLLALRAAGAGGALDAGETPLASDASPETLDTPTAPLPPDVASAPAPGDAPLFPPSLPEGAPASAPEAAADEMASESASETGAALEATSPAGDASPMSEETATRPAVSATPMDGAPETPESAIESAADEPAQTTPAAGDDTQGLSSPDPSDAAPEE